MLVNNSTISTVVCRTREEQRLFWDWDISSLTGDDCRCLAWKKGQQEKKVQTHICFHLGKCRSNREYYGCEWFVRHRRNVTWTVFDIWVNLFAADVSQDSSQTTINQSIQDRIIFVQYWTGMIKFITRDYIVWRSPGFVTAMGTVKNYTVNR